MVTGQYKKEDEHMLNYSVKFNSIKDLMELRKIAGKYGIDGRINQNGFHGNLKSVLTNVFYLPLEDANIEVTNFTDSQVSYLDKASEKFTA